MTGSALAHLRAPIDHDLPFPDVRRSRGRRLSLELRVRRRPRVGAARTAAGPTMVLAMSPAPPAQAWERKSTRRHRGECGVRCTAIGMARSHAVSPTELAHALRLLADHEDAVVDATPHTGTEDAYRMALACVREHLGSPAVANAPAQVPTKAERAPRGRSASPTADLPDAARAVPDASLLVRELERLVRHIVAEVVQPAAREPYTSRNLPPGVTARAFADAIRRGDVPTAKIGGRHLVDPADWEAFKERCRASRARGGPAKTRPREKAVARAASSDDALLASVGARRARR